jgi:hypothetical protein
LKSYTTRLAKEPPEERAALLAGTDPELRREVEMLLSQSRGCDFFDRPAIQNAPELLDDSGRAGVAPGTLVGPYRIERKLGEGGISTLYPPAGPA